MTDIKMSESTAISSHGVLLAALFFAASALILPIGDAVALIPTWQTLSPGGIGDPNAAPSDIVAIPDGGVVVTGGYHDNYAFPGTQGILTIGFDAEGKQRWSARLQVRAFSHERAKLAADQDGHVFVAGAGSLPDRPALPWHIAKFDQISGERLWLIGVGIPGDNAEDEAKLIADQAGDLLLATTEQIPPSGHRWRIRKLSGSDGSVLWDSTLPALVDTENDRIAGLSLLASGDLALVGTHTLDHGAGPQPSMLTLVMSGSDGQVVWSEYELDKPYVSQGLDVRTDADGGVVAMGLSDQIELIKFSMGGERQWSVPLIQVNGAQEPLFDVAPDGDVVVAVHGGSDETTLYRLDGTNGSTESNTPLPSSPGVSSQLYDLHTDEVDRIHLLRRRFDPNTLVRSDTLQAFSGDPVALIWTFENEIPTGDTPSFSGLSMTDSKDIYLSGPDRSDEGGDDFRIDKVNASNGEVNWTRHEIDRHMPDSLLCGSIAGSGRTSVIAGDADVIYMGCRRVDANTRGLHVERISASGTSIWAVELESSESSGVLAADLALDEFENVHVAFIGEAEGGSELVTVRLSGTTGVQLGRQTHGTSDEFSVNPSFKLQLDQSGARYVTWRNPTSGTSATFLARYDLESAEPVWTEQIPPPAEGSQTLAVMGLDAAGNPVLGGALTEVGSPNSVPALQVRDRANGDLLWHDIETMSGGVLSVDLSGDGDLLVARGGPFSPGIKFSKHRPDGTEVWRSGLLAPEGSGALLNDFIVGGNGDIYFAGRSVDSIFPPAGRFLSGAIHGESGALLWIDAFATPGVAVTEANSVVETGDGLVRVAGFGSSGETYAQTLIFDYAPLTGHRLATHVLGGEFTLRLHSTGKGSYRLVDDFDSLEGRRIRVFRLEETEVIFRNGFDAFDP